MPAGYLMTSRIPQIIQKSSKGVSAVNEATAKRIAQEAKQRAPRGSTGDLAGGIEAKPASGDDWGVAIGAFYWLFQEYGTINQPARPFLTPAAEAERERHRKAIKDLYS